MLEAFTLDGRTRDQVRLELLALMPQTVAYLYLNLPSEQDKLDIMTLSSRLSDSEDVALLDALTAAINKGLRMPHIIGEMELGILPKKIGTTETYTHIAKGYKVMQTAHYYEGHYADCIFAPNSVISDDCTFSGGIGIGAGSLVTNDLKPAYQQNTVIATAPNTKFIHQYYTEGNALRVILETYQQKVASVRSAQ
jgi:hypothetical protein